MFGCVLSRLKPSELYILSCENGRGRDFLGLYPILRYVGGGAGGGSDQNEVNGENGDQYYSLQCSG